VTVQIVAKESNNGTLVIWDIHGKKILQTSIQQKIQLDISAFNFGLYIVQIQSGASTFNKRFLKK
jgi:hypothetical protein